MVKLVLDSDAEDQLVRSVELAVKWLFVDRPTNSKEVFVGLTPSNFIGFFDGTMALKGWEAMPLAIYKKSRGRLVQFHSGIVDTDLRELLLKAADVATTKYM